MYNGLNLNLGNLSRLSDAQTRSISAENFTGEKGKGGMATEGNGGRASRELGQGWKVSPSVTIKAGETFHLADIEGPGAIQQIWMTPTGTWRHSIFRVYWDGEETPSIEVPIGDFFGQGWGRYAHMNSIPVCVNPGSAFNCYWEMPFRKHCRMTFENIGPENMVLYYQINYTLTEVPDTAAYLHAQFRRINPLPYKEIFTLVDGIRGKGQYVGTYMAWGANSPGWWGEGEIKFFIDGDSQYPTVCGTGTEDYFCGSYGFEIDKKYQVFTTPYAGMHQYIAPPEGKEQHRFGLYRWHVMDPVRFAQELRVTIQALGWQSDNRYLPLQDDLASVAFWYQTEPHTAFPALPPREKLDIV